MCPIIDTSYDYSWVFNKKQKIIRVAAGCFLKVEINTINKSNNESK